MEEKAGSNAILNDVSLSVVVVIGADRERAHEMLLALGAQTAVDHLEAVIVDTAADLSPVVAPTKRLRTTYVRLGQDGSWGHARYEGLRAARASVVAYLEDHCIPAKDWGEMIIAAHQDPWAAVGYAFTNGSPDTYQFRAIFMAEYGFWADPAAHGATRLLPGNNMSYKREALLSLGDELELRLSDDITIQKMLLAQGRGISVEARALVAHQSTGLRDAMSGHFSLARLSASTCFRDRSSMFSRRIGLALVTPFLFPPIRALRLFRSLQNRRGLRRTFFFSLPIVYLIYQWAAFGVSMGYLFGEGVSRKDFDWAQLNAPRIRNNSSQRSSFLDGS